MEIPGSLKLWVGILQPAGLWLASISSLAPIDQSQACWLLIFPSLSDPNVSIIPTKN